MDSAIIDWLNGAAARHDRFGDLAQWSAAHMPLALGLTLAAGWLVVAAHDVRQRRRLAWQRVEVPLAVALAVGLGLAMNHVLGDLWFRSRPYDASSSVHLLRPASADPSFPSDHATAASAIVLIVLTASLWLGGVLAAESLLLFVGRIAVGLHYPSDILGGFFVALIAAATAQAVVRSPRRWVPASVVGRVDRLVAPPDVADGSASWLYAAGLTAALLGLPGLIEVVVDPIEIDPQWLETAVLGAAAVAAVGLRVLLAGGTTQWRGRKAA